MCDAPFLPLLLFVLYVRTNPPQSTLTPWDVPYCLFIVPLHLLAAVLLDRGGKNREKNQWRKRKNVFFGVHISNLAVWEREGSSG